MYYADKIESLRDIFGATMVAVDSQGITVDGRRYPVINDVVVFSEPSDWTPFVRERLGLSSRQPAIAAGDVQFTFGREWETYDTILPEHRKEFLQYFDLVDLDALSASRLCDAGCGMGRWSSFLASRVREMVLVDFSDAIFVARKTLSQNANCLFFMGDLRQLPFRDGFADLLFSLGVLHHLPTPCLDETRRLRRYAPRLLIFLYYALDNRPLVFRILLAAVTMVRQLTCRVRQPVFRRVFSRMVAAGVYRPLISLGAVANKFGWGSSIPLYEFYAGKSLYRIEQDVYDRFFTRIEQRVTRRSIMALKDTFAEVQISDHLPYWHFLCSRDRA